MEQKSDIQSIYYEAGPRQLHDWNFDKGVQEISKKDCFALKVYKKNLSIDALEKAVAALIERHESLRTYFASIKEKLMMGIYQHNIDIFSIQYYDLSELNDFSEKEKEVHKKNMELVCNLEKGPLFKLYVLKIPGTLYQINFIIHHIISDVWSLAIIKNELNSFYDSIVNDLPITLPSLSFDLKEYCAEKNILHSPGYKNRHIEFWDRKLRRFNAERCMTMWNKLLKEKDDSHRPAGKEMFDDLWKKLTRSHAKCCTGVVDSSFLYLLRTTSMRKGVSLRNILYAAFYLSFHRSFDISPILFASPIADRWSSKYKNIIGNLTGGIYLAKDSDEFNDLESFIQNINYDLIRTCRHLIFNHGEFELNEPVIRLNCNMFINFEPMSESKNRKLPLPEEGHFLHSFSYYSLSCYITEYENGLLCSWCYNDSLYTSGQIDILRNNYLWALERICSVLQ